MTSHGMFVTVWMGILELSTGKISAANAGHEYPAILRADGSDGFTLHKVPHSTPLAIFPGVTFTAEDLELGKGDVLFVYTDGVTDAERRDEKMFGEERLLSALGELKDESPKGIISGTHLAIEEFVGGNDQFDDITMLCIKYMGSPNG